MNLLNSKSILDCNEYEEEQHNQEIINFMEQVYNFENYDCALRIKRIDINKSEPNEIIKSCKLHQILEITEYFDIKNGVDLCMEDGFIIFICYGQAYELDGKHNFVTNLIQVLPYDENRKFLIFNELRKGC